MALTNSNFQTGSGKKVRKFFLCSQFIFVCPIDSSKSDFYKAISNDF